VLAVFGVLGVFGVFWRDLSVQLRGRCL